MQGPEAASETQQDSGLLAFPNLVRKRSWCVPSLVESLLKETKHCWGLKEGHLEGRTQQGLNLPEARHWLVTQAQATGILPLLGAPYTLFAACNRQSPSPDSHPSTWACRVSVCPSLSVLSPELPPEPPLLSLHSQ